MTNFSNQLSVLLYQHLLPTKTLKTEVIKNDISLSVSKGTTKKTKTYNDFSNEKIAFFGEEVTIKFRTIGHCCIVV